MADTTPTPDSTFGVTLPDGRRAAVGDFGRYVEVHLENGTVLGPFYGGDDLSPRRQALQEVSGLEGGAYGAWMADQM